MTLNTRTIAAAATTLVALALASVSTFALVANTGPVTSKSQLKPAIHGLIAQGGFPLASVGASAHVANTRPVTPESQLKPAIRGLISQGGFPPDSVLPYLEGVAANATWAELQPSLSANQTLTLVHPNPIDNVLKSLQKNPGKAHIMVKIRIFAGTSSPGWAMNLDGPAFQMNDFACVATPPPAGCNGGSLTYWFPKWWGPTYQAAYDRLERALGAAYDGIPAISEVNSPRCMMFFTEPMTRPWETWSETKLLNAGYTVPSDIACLEQEMISQATAWPHTRVTVNLNPYNDIVWKNGIPHRTENPATTQAIIGYCRLRLGAQCILENDELGRPSATPGDPKYSFLYPMMLAAGVGLSYEVDNRGYTHNRPLNQTLDVAVGWHAYSVELGYTYLKSKPPSFFATYNLALRGNLKTCTIATLTPDKKAPQLAGTAITFAATSTGCPNPQYQFWLQYAGGPWTVMQPFGNAATWTWDTARSRLGSYKIVVWANQAGNATSNFEAFAVANPTLTGCGPVSVSWTPKGTQVQLKARTTICSNPRYEFWMLAPGSGTWQDVQPYSANATLTWNTSGLPAGTYNFSVWVKDLNSGGAAGNSLGRWDNYASSRYRLT